MDGIGGAGGIGAFEGTGNSGMSPTDETVDGLDEDVPVVSGTDCSDALCGAYWNTGVGSCTFEPSRMEGTRLGLGGRRGGDCD